MTKLTKRKGLFPDFTSIRANEWYYIDRKTVNFLAFHGFLSIAMEPLKKRCKEELLSLEYYEDFNDNIVFRVI